MSTVAHMFTNIVSIVERRSVYMKLKPLHLPTPIHDLLFLLVSFAKWIPTGDSLVDMVPINADSQTLCV